VRTLVVGRWQTHPPPQKHGRIGHLAFLQSMAVSCNAILQISPLRFRLSSPRRQTLATMFQKKQERKEALLPKPRLFEESSMNDAFLLRLTHT